MSEAEGEALGRDFVRLPESDEELLRECEAETFRSGGPGGQHVNKVETGVRLRHLPSGMVVTCREARSQHRNKMNCLRKLREEAARLNHRPAKRVPTRRTRAAKQRTLEEKSRRSRVKQLRSKPRADD
jgi:protein subunit release factor B